jgi:DNA polymerase-3 subunit gamma/tau
VPSAVPEDLPELADIMRLAAAFDPQEVQLFYQIAVHGRNEIGLAPDEYAGFTMTLLRMLAFRPGNGGAEGVAPAGPAAARPAAPRPALAPARAASAAVASHAAVTPPPAPVQQARPAPVPPPAPAAAAPAPAATGAPAMNSARAAINAALEAARSASRGQNVSPKRPTAMSNQAAANAAAAPQPAPAAAPEPEPPAPAAAPAAPPPWDQPGVQAAAAAPVVQAAAPVEEDDGPPSWVTEFSDDTALEQDAPAVATAPAAARAPAVQRPAYVITPVPEIEWDGNWPALAATLALRGVSQQLAMQTELVECTSDGHQSTFRLRAPIDTLRASGNTEKLAAALQDRFPGTRVAVEIDLGPVWYTAGVEAQAYREQCMQQAEQTVAGDPFVQEMARQLGAFVVPGSVRPPAAAA